MGRMIRASVLVSLTVGSLCAAATIVVNADGTGDYPTVQAAIDDANDGDIIELQSGTYTGDGNRDIDFLGRAITVRSIDPNDPNIVAGTIIDCNGTEAEPHRGFYFHSSEGPNSILAGVTITNGYAGSGGGIYCPSGSPSISHCWIFGNAASEYGGGMRNTSRSSSPTLRNCLFSSNSADCGGGISNFQITATLSNCTLEGNSGRLGGAMYHQGSSSDKVRLTNCTISDNSAGRAGGIYSTGMTILRNCILWGNTDTGGMDESAQIGYGSPVVNYCCIQGWTGALGGIGNIGADPCFVDAVGGDYHISADSPCIDAGDPDPWPLPEETDIDGETRVMGGRVDMGVDESTAALILVITVSSTQFQFTAIEGDPNPNPPGQILAIRNIGPHILNWTIAEDCNWLTVEPNSGSLAVAEAEDVMLSVDVSGLEAGQYSCELTVLDPNAANSPRTVLVRLILETDCFPKLFSTYADWVAYGKPNCWCGTRGDPPWPYQCDGDADGRNSGPPFKYRIYTGDLNLIVANWKKKMGNPTLNPCADLDHKSSGAPFQYRVYTVDIHPVVRNWKKKDAQLPGNCPRPE